MNKTKVIKIKYTGQSIIGLLANMESLTKNKEYNVIIDNIDNIECVNVLDDCGKLFAIHKSRFEIIEYSENRNINIFNTKEKYNIIYADPPWEYKESGGGNRGTAGLPYSTMTTEDICNLPIQDISKKISILFIWATFRKLPECFKVINSWGFEYYGLGFDWVKLNKKTPTPFWGMGYYTRQNTEVCLIGVKKNKKHRLKPQVRNILSVIQSPKREHSRKPDEIRENIVKVCGDLPRVELFARQEHGGWDNWGNEI